MRLPGLEPGAGPIAHRRLFRSVAGAAQRGKLRASSGGVRALPGPRRVVPALQPKTEMSTAGRSSAHTASTSWMGFFRNSSNRASSRTSSWSVAVKACCRMM